MQIVFGLLFLLFFSACCLCVAACTRFDAALLPLPALCGSAVVLYLLSLLGLLQFGHFIIMAVWLAGGVYFGVRAGWRAIRQALFSPGFLLFVGGSCFLWVLFALQQPMFTQWDEFTAWGLAPKMVAERAALYVADPINLTASFTYPATSLVSYLFQRVPGQFYEWQCLAGLDILFLACIAPGGSHAAQKLGGCCVGVCCGLSSAVLFQRGSGGHPIHHVRQRHGGYPPGAAVWRNPVPVCRGGRAQNRLFCLCHATCRADHDQRYRFCLCLDRYVPDRAGSAVRYAAPGYKACPHFRRIAGKMQYSGGGGAGGVYQLEPLYRRRDPNRNHWGQRGQRGPELWCCADRRHQAAAGHWARRTLCPDHAEHGPGIFVPPCLFGGRAHHGRQLPFCCCSRRPLWRRLPVPHAAAPWLALWAGRSALSRCISST